MSSLYVKIYLLKRGNFVLALTLAIIHSINCRLEQ